MITKKYIFSLFAASALMLTGCDYNEEHFPGFDENPILETPQYEGEFTGSYPKEGYYTVEKQGSEYVLIAAQQADFQTAVNKVMNDIYPYADKGATAKLTNIQMAQIIPGAFKAEIEYELQKEDYDSMGIEDGQPGKFDNFDKNMNVDEFLIPFCAQKYADANNGAIVNIIYKYFAGSVSMKSAMYEKKDGNWVKSSVEGFVFDKEYTLAKEDYDSMGEPGSHDNFDSKMDVNFYLTTFLKVKFPYAKEGDVYKVAYKFYENKATQTRIAIYRLTKGEWAAFDPYADVVKVIVLNAFTTFDGTNWVVDRLQGNSLQLAMEEADYKTLFDWSLKNKPNYKSTQNDTDEYWFGISVKFNNINNKYNTWKKYYDVEGQYANLSDEQLQEVMDSRLAEGLATLMLPVRITEPSTEMAYVVSYTIHGGRGDGEYAMTFRYTGKAFEFISGPVKLN